MPQPQRRMGSEGPQKVSFTFTDFPLILLWPIHMNVSLVLISNFNNTQHCIWCRLIGLNLIWFAYHKSSLTALNCELSTNINITIFLFLPAEGTWHHKMLLHWRWLNKKRKKSWRCKNVLTSSVFLYSSYE